MLAGEQLDNLNVGLVQAQPANGCGRKRRADRGMVVRSGDLAYVMQ
jgi:hypothetical protein